MKFRSLYIILLFAEICLGQNLVQNPSFEDYISCPYGYYGMVQNAIGWSPFRESPDYAHACANSIPTSPAGYQVPLTGHAYTSFIAYAAHQNGNYREHIGGTLCDSLTIGQKYFVSINVCRTEDWTGSSNKIGVRFSTKSMNPNLFGSLPNSAHIYTDSVINDNINWTKINGSFIADSSYKYIVIGNFFDSLNTTQHGNGAYYFLDDICVSLDSLTCNSKIPKSILGNDSVLCAGQSIILNVTTPNSNYIWQDNTTNPTYIITQPGQYWVKVKSNNCNYQTDTINISYKDLPVINFPNDTIICQYDSMLIDVTNSNCFYQWQDNSTESTYLIKKEGLFWVKVTDSYCANIDSVNVKTEVCEIIFEAPNVFTPNGDGINDLWKLPKELNNYKLFIHNRWGNKIFETSSIHYWDGRTTNGEKCVDGNYFYVISTEEKTYKGFIQLVR